jgi:methylthioadenosine phosphorylase (EC 2.4.2.28)
MLGIIGGSGLYRMDGLKNLREVSLNTPFGEPSSPVILGELSGKQVAFISRHGLNHQYPPFLVPYRANLLAFKELGVRRVLAISAVGAINERFKPGDFVVVDDLIDLTKRREDTFYKGIYSVDVQGEDKPSKLLRGKKVVHVDMTQAYCPHMRKVLIETLEELKLSYHPAGVYACTEGPRFETPAEIRAIKLLGGDVGRYDRLSGGCLGEGARYVLCKPLCSGKPSGRHCRLSSNQRGGYFNDEKQGGGNKGGAKALCRESPRGEIMRM